MASEERLTTFTGRSDGQALVQAPALDLPAQDIYGVENAAPVRPLLSITIRPPVPEVLRPRILTASSAAA